MGSNSDGFNYVDIEYGSVISEGWLNLFFGDECIALVSNIHLANGIREVTPKRNSG